VKAGTVPLAGVIIAATNRHTGKKFITITDGTGLYRFILPQDGTYFIYAESPDLISSSKLVQIDSTNRRPRVDFLFQSGQLGQWSPTALGSVWPTLLLPPISISTLSLQPATTITGGTGGGQFPSFPGDPQYSGDAFAINGQTAIVNPYFQLADQMRSDFEDGNQLQGPPMQPVIATSTTSTSANSSTTTASSTTGSSSTSATSGSPQSSGIHGQAFWNGGNSGLNAQPYVLAGQPPPNPSYYSNSYGATVGLQPFIPGVTKPSPRDFLLLAYSGQSSTSLIQQYGTVPTELERQGNFSQLTNSTGGLIPIYPPRSITPYPNNTINSPLDPAALGLLQYLPAPNIATDAGLNYRLLTTQGAHQNTVGATYTHTFGVLPATHGTTPAASDDSAAPAAPLATHSLNLNFNFGEITGDVVNLFPHLGGQQRLQGYSLSGAYTITKGSRATSIILSTTRNNAQVRNYFTGHQDIASALGIYADEFKNPVNSNPFNFGLPNLVLNGYTNFSETQPNSQLTQTFNIASVTSFTRGTHILRFGADIHRLEYNLLGGPNATGTYIFSGAYTQVEGDAKNNPVAITGNAFADFLLGLPQETTLESPNQKAYTRQTNWEGFIRDDWRIHRDLTLCLGLRYDYFSPFVEINNHLSTLDYNSDFSDIAAVQPNGVGSVSGAKYSRSLVNPDRNNFSPHLGLAWRVTRGTVVRSSYGINYTVGQYGTFVENLAYQPPFANVQSNGNVPHFITPFPLQSGFGNAADMGNYAINRNYQTPYIQNWYLEIQQALPLDFFLNVGYIGSKGTHLDVISAPGIINNSLPFTSSYFDFEDSSAFSRFNSLVVHLKKPMQKSLVLEGTYIYSHSIDDASSTNAGIPVVAQNWQDIAAESGNSAFDIRHMFTGSFLYQLPIGPSKAFLNNRNWISRAFGNWTLAGTVYLASGLPLTPYVSASAAEVERGTHASVRPDRVPGTSITAGGGHLDHWFNTAAFSTQFALGQLYGNASRYSIPGPGTDVVNLSLSKLFPFRESRSLEVRITAANAFNKVQYSGVDTQIGSSAFGQVNAVQPMRQLTFLARFLF